MIFGPAWTRPLEPVTAVEGEALLTVVRAAAERLVADLERAERLTENWMNQWLSRAAVASAFSTCLNHLAATGCWGEANQLPSSELWRIAGPLLARGRLQNHARTKPHGYAGDHEMLTRIWQRSCCEDPLGGVFDWYFLSQAAPEAVRARLEQIASALAMHCLDRERQDYCVVSVGSGAAIDIREGLLALPESRRRRVRVRLLDLDPHALDFAAEGVATLLPVGALSCLRTNLYRLPQQSRATETIPSADLLVCSGLFDYLADEPARAMLRLFWERTGEGGMLLVGNFAPHNPTRAYMEWIGNWYLRYRTADEFERMATEAGIPRGQFTIGCDRTGVNLFLTARK
ncbi:MAG: hypothetical protein GXY83_21485 [Rhodopirellula sp.]|nr:hypothetical protein [Rhodopirellula sp.]